MRNVTGCFSYFGQKFANLLKSSSYHTSHLSNLCTAWVSFAYQLGASRHLDGGDVVRDQTFNFSHVG